MSAHTSHETVIPAPVLYDGCPRCAEHAEHPLASLDEGHIRRLWEEMIAVEFSGKSLFDGNPHYASRNDAIAGKRLYELAVMLERFSVDVNWKEWPIKAATPFDRSAA